MIETYPCSRYLRQLTVVNGWQRELIHDEHGRPLLIVAVRVGPRFTDAVVIEGEDQVSALRYHTRDEQLLTPPRLPSEAGAVWCRDGRAEDVLAELVALPTG